MSLRCSPVDAPERCPSGGAQYPDDPTVPNVKYTFQGQRRRRDQGRVGLRGRDPSPQAASGIRSDAGDVTAGDTDRHREIGRSTGVGARTFDDTVIAGRGTPVGRS